MMQGVLYGVGVGPGDPELMTLKAIRIISECDVIAVPGKNPAESVALSIAKKAIGDIDKKEILHLITPMTKNAVVLEEAYEKNVGLLEDTLDLGKSVAFLTLGDPTVYSTYMYMHKKIRDDGYNAYIVSGVTSFCAAAAKAEVSLAEHNDRLHILPASYKIEDALCEDGNVVLMKAGSKLADVKDILRNDGRRAVMVQNCGWSDERVYTEIDDFPEDAYLTTILLYKDER